MTIQGLQLVQEANQMLKAAAKPIHGPGRYHVHLAGSGIVEQPGGS
jgi:hypothetical protein